GMWRAGYGGRWRSGEGRGRFATGIGSNRAGDASPRPGSHSGLAPHPRHRNEVGERGEDRTQEC
ncbi:MAG: hypothetical protein ACK5CQ_07055, partial [Cyanobacteriota bacterium]